MPHASGLRPANLDVLAPVLELENEQVRTEPCEVGARYQRAVAIRSQNRADTLPMKRKLRNLEVVDVQPSLADFFR